MDFNLSEEQIMIRDAARDYAQRELIQDVIERDREARFPEKHVKALAELGFMGMMVDPKYDGGGMDTVSYVLAMEEISKIDSSVGIFGDVFEIGRIRSITDRDIGMHNNKGNVYP